MASSTITRGPDSSRSSGSRDGKLVQYDKFIQVQIGKTGRQVKLVEIAVAITFLLALLLAYVLVVVLFDHWLVSGGLGFRGRFIAFIGFVAGGAIYLLWRVVPLLTRRVNPIYAAQAIEQTQPTLKNSIINFLLLRRERGALAAPVYEAIESRAATDLAQVPVESAVDHSHLLKIGYVLLALVVVFCLYKLLSPKDPLRTFERMAAPWADLAPPTRVTIGDIQPGSTKVFQGEKAKISAVVMGLRRDEPVTLYFSTTDGQAVNQPIAMRLPKDSYRYEVTLPPDDAGIDQTISYFIAAGDATSPRYKIVAVTAPAILVDRVEYQYPEYAEVPPRVVEHQGDLQGIEGTKVTIEARANVPISTAYIDFNADGGRDLALAVDGRKAVGSFVLALAGDRPLYDCYQIRFIDPDGHENPQPIRHSIEVVADQPPAVEITAPAKDLTEVAANGSLPISLRAADRDFKLRRVTLFFEPHGRPMAGEVLLDQSHAGTFQGGFVFQPAKLDQFPLKPGDEVEYWAEARDNRAPTANRTETVHYKIRVGDKVSQPEAERQQQVAEQTAQDAERPKDSPRPPAEEPQAAKNESQPKKDPKNGQQPQAAEEKLPDQQPQAADRPTEQDQPIARQQQQPPDRAPDPVNNPAEAMERILEHEQEKNPQQPQQPSQPPQDKSRQKQQNQNQHPPQQNQQQQAGQQNQQQQAGQQNNAPNQQQQPAPGQPPNQPQQQPGANQSQQKSQSGGQGQQPANQQQSGQQQSGQQQSGQQQGGGQQGAQQQGGQQGGQQQGGQQQGGQQQGGQQQGGQQQGGQQQGQSSGQQSASNNPSTADQQNQSQAGNNQPSTASQAAGQSNGQSGNNQSGQNQGNQSAAQNQSAQQSGNQQAGQQSTGQQGSQQQSGQQQNNQQQAGQSQASQNQSGGQQQQSANGGQSGQKQGQQNQPSNPSAAGQNQQSQPANQSPQNQQGNSPSNSPSAQAGKQQAGQSPNQPNQSANQSAGQQNTPDANQPPQSGQQQSGQNPQQSSQQSGQSPQANKSPQQSPQQPQHGGQQSSNPSAQGQGDKSDEQGAGQNKNQSPSQQPQQPGATGGDPKSQSGNSGAGQSSQKNNPSPEPQNSNQARQKQSRQNSASASQNQNQDAASSPSNSDRESNSQGGESGDRSGGGKQGGGQKANAPGTGSPGQNTAADQGEGQAQGAGQGEASSSAGNQTAGNQPSQGQGSQTAGAGRQGQSRSNLGSSSSSSGGNASGGAPGGSRNATQSGARVGDHKLDPNRDQPADQPPAAEKLNTANDRLQPGGMQVGPSDAGGPADQGDQQAKVEEQNTPADPANLEFKKKATDLVLSSLKDQLNRGDVDPDLLKKLNWTPDDLRKFVDRWDALRQQAKDDPNARRKFDQALENLHLRRRGVATKQQGGRGDDRSLREMRWTSPPPEYVEQFKAYTEGAAKTQR